MSACACTSAADRVARPTVGTGLTQVSPGFKGLDSLWPVVAGFVLTVLLGLAGHDESRWICQVWAGLGTVWQILADLVAAGFTGPDGY